MNAPFGESALVAFQRFRGQGAAYLCLLGILHHAAQGCGIEFLGSHHVNGMHFASARRQRLCRTPQRRLVAEEVAHDGDSEGAGWPRERSGQPRRSSWSYRA
jgi:hypothetical protein